MEIQKEMSNLNEYTEYRIAVYLWKSVPPVLLVLGTVGNLLTIFVLMRRKNRQSTTAIYLTALAILDILVIWTGALRHWIKYMFTVDIRNLSVIGCKFHVFLVHALFQCSSWVLVAVTMERFIAVWFPHAVKFLCRKRNAGIVISFITVFLVLLNCHWFYGVTLKSTINNNITAAVHCEIIDNEIYIKFYDIWKWIDLCVYSLVPLIIFTVANISIISRIVYRQHRARIKIAPNNSVNNNMKTSQLTVMLVTINTVFILCSTPISIYIIVSKPDVIVKNIQNIAVHNLWWAVVNLLAYLNNTLNFIFYFLSGSNFRQQVKDLLFCR